MITAAFWICAVLLLCWNAACLVSQLFLLPGNWLMVAATGAFVLGFSFVHDGPAYGPGWITVGIAAGLAAIGELVELVAGSAASSKLGASRRSMVLSLFASIVGSLLCAPLIPVPVIGTAVGALLGACGGAFLGAYAGEAWKGQLAPERAAIGKAAMTGRVIGMVLKMAIGAAIFIVVLVSLFF